MPVILSRIRHQWRPGLGMLVLLSSFGCQSQTHTGPDLLINPLGARKLGYHYQWSTDLAIPPGSRLDQAEVLDDLLVVIESPSNMVSAISLQDGTVRWVRSVASSLDRVYGALRSGDRVLVNSETRLYSLAAETGTIVDSRNLKTSVAAPPALAGGLLIFGATDGQVFAQNLWDGFDRWTIQLSGQEATRPVLAGNGLFVADDAGSYALLAIDNGALLRDGRTFARISATPTVGDASLFVASEDATLYALNGVTLQDRWKFRATRPLTRSPKVLGNMVFLTVPGYGLVALDAASGKKLWERRGRAEPITRRRDKLLILDRGALVLVMADTGAQIVQVPVKPLNRVLTTADDNLILVSPEGRLMRLDRV